MSTQTPPGWYADPQVPGQQRYWDGVQWTEHVSAAQQQAAYAPQAPAQAWGVSQDARQWAMFAHLSGIIGGFLGPLIIYLIKKDDDPFIADQSREALNFQLSVLIYAFVSAVLILVIIGIFLIFAVVIGALVLAIMAAVKANNGEAYRYPLTIRMVS